MTVFSATADPTNDISFSYANFGGGWGGAGVGQRIGNSGSLGVCNGYVAYGSVTIAGGSTISAATQTYTAQGGSSGTTCNVFVGCEDADAAVMPTTYSDAQSRAYTSHKTSWSSLSAWSNSVVYTSDDFATSVQDVVNRGGWGNKLLVMTRDNASSGSADRYSTASGIDITYTAGGGGGLIPGQFLYNRAVNRASFF